MAHTFPGNYSVAIELRVATRYTVMDPRSPFKSVHTFLDRIIKSKSSTIQLSYNHFHKNLGITCRPYLVMTGEPLYVRKQGDMTALREVNLGKPTDTANIPRSFNEAKRFTGFKES